MKISVVSDIHGNAEALRRVAAEAEFLVVLGDMLDYVDYHDPESGVVGQTFGAEASLRFARLRRAGDFTALHDYDASLWSGVRDPDATLRAIVGERYAEMSASLGPNTFVTLGNVDLRDLWDEVVPDHLRCLDGRAVELAGRTIGFVGGGAVKAPPVGSPWTSFDRTPDVFRERLDRLGPVDILCTHVPPKLEDLRFDVRANRLEMYGPGIVEYLDAHQPPLSLFGHVHNPRAHEASYGSTRCVNVGYFKRDGLAFDFETEASYFQA